MNFDVQTVRCPIKRITKQVGHTSDGLYVFYLGIQTIDADMKVKTSSIKRFHPIAATGNHELPTSEGFKKASDIKKGDVILLSLILACKK